MEIDWAVSVDVPDELLAFYHPETLLYTLNERFETAEAVRLTNIDGETQVLVESFVAGREFSCIVVEDPDGQPGESSRAVEGGGEVRGCVATGSPGR